jgi:CRP-like cAMP-binding protein
MHDGRSHRDLPRIWLFSGCPQAELPKITKVLEAVTVPNGTLIVEQQEAGLLSFVVLTGTAEVVRGNHPVAELAPGDCFGEPALLGNQPGYASVSSSTDMTLLVLRRRHFQRWPRRHPP